MKVYVVMSNDYPHCVFATEENAKIFVESRNNKESEQKIYWKYYDFEVRNGL